MPSIKETMQEYSLLWEKHKESTIKITTQVIATTLATIFWLFLLPYQEEITKPVFWLISQVPQEYKKAFNKGTDWLLKQMPKSEAQIEIERRVCLATPGCKPKGQSDVFKECVKDKITKVVAMQLHYVCNNITPNHGCKSAELKHRLYWWPITINVAKYSFMQKANTKNIEIGYAESIFISHPTEEDFTCQNLPETRIIIYKNTDCDSLQNCRFLQATKRPDISTILTEGNIKKLDGAYYRRKGYKWPR